MIEIKKTALPQIRTFNKINDIPTTSPFLVSGLLNASMETISAESEGEKWSTKQKNKTNKWMNKRWIARGGDRCNR